MPRNLHIRNLDDDLVARLKRRAAKVKPPFDSLAAVLRKVTKGRKQTPSEVLLREERKKR